MQYQGQSNGDLYSRFGWPSNQSKPNQTMHIKPYMILGLVFWPVKIKKRPAQWSKLVKLVSTICLEPDLCTNSQFVSIMPLCWDPSNLWQNISFESQLLWNEHISEFFVFKSRNKDELILKFFSFQILKVDVRILGHLVLDNWVLLVRIGQNWSKSKLDKIAAENEIQQLHQLVWKSSIFLVC